MMWPQRKEVSHNAGDSRMGCGEPQQRAAPRVMSGLPVVTLLAGNQMGFPTVDLNSVGVMEGHQRTQMCQFLRQDDVVHLLARAHPHVHVGWAVAGGLGGSQGGDDLPAFIREDRDFHLRGLHTDSDARREIVSLSAGSGARRLSASRSSVCRP
jgi:hypothetical protein